MFPKTFNFIKQAFLIKFIASLFFILSFHFFLFSLQQECVTGHLYLGFSDVSSDHFFYGTLSPVSLQKLLEVWNIQNKLPGAMATIGFPEGLQVQT